jgi:hypothetical protein
MTITRDQDSISVLTSRGPLLTKRWLADGEIEGHGRAKQHTLEAFPVANIFDVAQVLAQLASRPTSCVIRGEYIGHELAAQVSDPDGERKGRLVLRQVAYFTDPARHWIMLDVDKYVPLLADPDEEPLEAIQEWIRFNLPKEFWEISFYWQLSSSAGHPSKRGTLRAHLWFWLDRALTSPEAHAWVTMTKLPVDRAPMNVVQAHYTADPVMAPGVIDPLAVRGGVYPGLFGDSVPLEINEGALAVALLNYRGTAGGDREGAGYGDPRQKPGLVGAFCRAFSVEDVLMAEWFPGSFERITERRYTWLDGNGAAEGAFINDEGTHLTNTHNTAPLDTINQPLNAYDLARIYKFGELDEAVPEDDRWAWVKATDYPSDEAMRKFARALPEVQAELDNGPDNDNPFGQDGPEVDADDVHPSPAADMSDLGIPAPAAVLAPVKSEDERWGKAMGKKLKGVLHFLGLTDDEIAEVIDGPVLTAAWRGCFFNPNQAKLYLMNKAGDLVQFAQADWGSMVAATFGQILDADKLDAAAARLGMETNTPAAKVAEELRKQAWEVFSNHVKLYRQRGELQYRVDMFANKATVTLTPTAAAVTYAHEAFPVRAIELPEGAEAAIVAEYREHFPFFDTVLDLFLHARFATDRRQAFLWMKCMAGWGKGFLLDGVLGKDGLKLVTEMNVKDVERAFEGNPSAIQASDVVRAWCLAFDEFKAVKGELKQLNNSITAAPKNQLRFKCEVFVKLFLSAEGVDSLVGADGVEQQFADRFAIHEVEDGARSVDDLPLFVLYGKAAYRTVLANYAAVRLNTGVEAMRALGVLGASKAGDEWLRQFHGDHGIGTRYALLGDNLPEMADELTGLVLDWARRGQGMPLQRHGRLDNLQPALKSALDRSIEVVKGALAKKQAETDPAILVVLSKTQALVKTWVNATKDRSEAAMINHKAGQISSLLCGGGEEATRALRDGVPYYATNPEKGRLAPRQKVKGTVLVLVEPEQVAEVEATFMGSGKVVYPEFGTKED